jgi:hypothetical protein
MWAWIKQKAADIFNESKDPTATCPVRLGGYGTLGVMGWKFLQMTPITGDAFQAFGLGAAAVLAAIVMKQHIEGDR